MNSYFSASFSGLLGQVEHELTQSGIDRSIVQSELIAFTSLLTQGTADVLWPNGQPIPVGASVLVVAPSRSGKSAIFKELMRVIEGVLAEVIPDQDSPDSPDFFMENSDKESILIHLKQWPIAGLFTEEGGQLKRLIGNDSSTLVKLIDGDPIRHARVRTGRIESLEHRFTMLLLEQPDIFEASKKQIGAGKGSVGLINRFFVASANGLINEQAIFNLGLTESTMRQFAQKAKELLERSIQREKRPRLKLSPSASQFLQRVNSDLRNELSGHPRFNDVENYIGRHAERVLRLAGAIHAFEFGTSSEIELATVRAADQFGYVSMNAFLHLTYVEPQPSQAEIDAQTLYMGLLNGLVVSSSQKGVLVSDVRRLAPNIGLTKSRFEKALPVLCQQGKGKGKGKAEIYTIGRKEWMHIFPPYAGIPFNQQTYAQFLSIAR